MGVDVELLLHHKFNALIGRCTHDVSTSISRDCQRCGQQFDGIAVPEAVHSRSHSVQEGDSRAVSGRCGHVLILRFSIGRTTIRDDRRADLNHTRTARTRNDFGDAEGLQNASALLGDVVNSKDVCDSKRIANLNRAAANRDGQALVAVVNVRNFTRTSRRGGLGGVILVSAVNRHGGASSRRQAGCIVHLVGLEASHFANVSATIRFGRDLNQSLTCSQVSSHPVIVTSGQRIVAVAHHHALLVHQSINLCNISEARCSGGALGNDSALVGSHSQNGHVDVRSQLLSSSLTQTVFLQLVAQFFCGQQRRRVLLVANGGRHSKLGRVFEVGRSVRTIKRLCNVGFGAPDGVRRTLHLLAVGVILGDQR